MPVRWLFSALVLSLVLTPFPIYSSSYHVAVLGTSTGDGSTAKPWSLQYALSHPPSVKPGDTIWVHGGRYYSSGTELNSLYKVRLQGAPGAPIIVRNYNNERAIIDGNNIATNWILYMDPVCKYTWLWGLELSNSNVPSRHSTTSDGAGPDVAMSEGINSVGSEGTGQSEGNKFINMIFHDFKSQLFSADQKNAEVYGCLAYNVGWNKADRPSGYPVYAQNRYGRKTFKHNIFVNNYYWAIHVYGSRTAYLDSFTVDGNICKGSGIFLGGGANYMKGDSIINNSFFNTWDPPASGGITLGYSDNGPWGAIVRNNWLHSACYTMIIRYDTLCVVENNTFFSLPNEQNSTQTTSNGRTFRANFPKNAFRESSTKPTYGDTVFVFPNKYEPERAHLCTWNLSGLDSIWVNVSGIYKDGDLVDVYNAQNYFGDPPHRATVRGTRIRIPMMQRRWTLAIPSGETQPREGNSFPDWGAFITQLVSVTKTDVHGEVPLPGEIELRQNYPNPFNPTTTIEFAIPVQSRTVLKVYSMLGEEVATIVDQVLEAGEYRFPWQSKGVPSGAYVYSLAAGVHRITRRMMLLR